MINEKLKLIPHLPGSYQMYNKDGIIIYVGKAKDLNKRVNSYFNREHTGKTAKMVAEITNFEYIVASSELEAFVLELNLIKKYDPKYNILLRDDKSYPYIEYINNSYPRLKVSRYLQIKKSDNHRLFGPYPNAYAARRIVNIINRLYPLKKCETMSKDVCLYYHIGECLGYCKKNIDQEKVNEMENEILSFLRGNDKILRDRIIKKINLYNENLNFEASKELKEELQYIDVILEKQKVELHDFVNRDIINFYLLDGYVSIEFFFIRRGKLLGHHSDIWELTNNDLEEIETYIAKFYTKHEIPREIIVNKDLNTSLLSQMLNTNFVVPKIGQKKKLLDLVYTNAVINLENKMVNINNSKKRTEDAASALGSLLKIDNLYRIDAFDNSNLFGDYAVSGLVVFKNGIKSPHDYRKFKVSVNINDDYHTMQEILMRHYKKVIVNNLELPQLIIVDGGENQIRAAKKVLDDLNLKIELAGLKKDDHHNTNILLDKNLTPFTIDKHSDLFHFLTNIQDEVHRFTITYHRTIRDKGVYRSVLDQIPGVGKNRRIKLLKKFGSINNIKEASVLELEKVVSSNLATTIYNFFHSK